MASGQQVGSYILGGLFVGIWLYIVLFGMPGEDLANGRWIFWGVIGFLIAGAIYGSRIAQGGLRIALFVTIGIAIAMVFMALIAQEIEEGWATLITFLGGALIVSAIPRDLPPAQPAPQA